MLRAEKAKPVVEACIRQLRAKGDGILKIGKKLGIGTSVCSGSSAPWARDNRHDTPTTGLLPWPPGLTSTKVSFVSGVSGACTLSHLKNNPPHARGENENRPRSRSISRSRTWVSSACCDSVPTNDLGSFDRHIRCFAIDDPPCHQQRTFQSLGDVDAKFGQ
jgi:hypothetical protein